MKHCLKNQTYEMDFSIFIKCHSHQGATKNATYILINCESKQENYWAGITWSDVEERNKALIKKLTKYFRIFLLMLIFRGFFPQNALAKSSFFDSHGNILSRSFMYDYQLHFLYIQGLIKWSELCKSPKNLQCCWYIFQPSHHDDFVVSI